MNADPPDTSGGPLTAERVLRATEEVLRRHGPAKATVVDVARALGVSHGSVYRHFATKSALREAVILRWLHDVCGGLTDLVTEDSPAEDRLRRWLDELFRAKRERAFADPELFATYLVLATEASEVIDAHLGDMIDQLARIIADGVRSGEFVAPVPEVTARAVLDATARFHNPAHAAEWSSPEIHVEYDAVCSLVLVGLRGS